MKVRASADDDQRHLWAQLSASCPSRREGEHRPDRASRIPTVVGESLQTGELAWSRDHVSETTETSHVNSTAPGNCMSESSIEEA